MLNPEFLPYSPSLPQEVPDVVEPFHATEEISCAKGKKYKLYFIVSMFAKTNILTCETAAVLHRN